MSLEYSLVAKRKLLFPYLICLFIFGVVAYFNHLNPINNKYVAYETVELINNGYFETFVYSLFFTIIMYAFLSGTYNLFIRPVTEIQKLFTNKVSNILLFTALIFASIFFFVETIYFERTHHLCFDSSGRVETDDLGNEKFIDTSKPNGYRRGGGGGFYEELWVKNGYSCPSYENFMRLNDTAPTRYTAGELSLIR